MEGEEEEMEDDEDEDKTLIELDDLNDKEK